MADVITPGGLPNETRDAGPEPDQDRTADSVATNLEAWATDVDNWTRTSRFASGFGRWRAEMAPQLRDGAAFVREQGERIRELEARLAGELAGQVPPAGRCGMGMDRPPVVSR